ncbi:MAG: ring-opening amidohydrolase [Acidimicrobiales bacterium]
MPYVVHKFVLESVTDASGLAGLITSGAFAADDVVAVIGKTEGNGGVNDFTRILADQAFRAVLLDLGSRGREAVREVPMVWSGGTDGVLTPHATVFAQVPADGTGTGTGTGSATGTRSATGGDHSEARLSVGVAMSGVILPEDIGRPAMVATVAEGVRRAMADAGIDDPADVHYVQTKTPLLTMTTIEEARARGETTATDEPLDSMNLSNGTTALGIGVALGEIEDPPAEAIGRDLSLFSSVASCSSGVELDRAQIVVVGNAPGAGGRFRIGHSVMRDALDAEGIYAAVRSAGLDLPERPTATDVGDRLVNVFIKCEADPTSRLRGRRQVALDDSDVHHHRHIKAAVGGIAAAAIGDPAVFVSVAALHQGPSGGGPVAAVVDVGPA